MGFGEQRGLRHPHHQQQQQQQEGRAGVGARGRVGAACRSLEGHCFRCEEHGGGGGVTVVWEKGQGKGPCNFCNLKQPLQSGDGGACAPGVLKVS